MWEISIGLHFREIGPASQDFFSCPALFFASAAKQKYLNNNELALCFMPRIKLWIKQEFALSSRRQFSEILLPSAGTVQLTGNDVVLATWMSTNFRLDFRHRDGFCIKREIWLSK